jgi:fermentation-respiration switch protein FrsA (DUF1100 family)
MIRALRVLPLISCLLVAQPAGGPSSLARKALDAVLNGRYAEFRQMGTADLQKDLTEEALAKIGAQFKNHGAVEKISDPVVSKIGPNSAVVIPVKFANQSINFRFIVNSSGLISGFFTLPGETAWQRPPYSKPDTFTERPIVLGEDPWKLPGTLSLPNGPGPFPAVVLVHGIGANDRDETVGGVKMFKDLAEGLASRGVVVIRYEKRTKQYASRMAGNTNYTLHDETAEDAVKAAALLRTLPNVDPKRIFIVGHSLGGYASPRIATEDPQIAGLILLAANAQHIEDLVVEQVVSSGGTAKVLESAKALQAKVKSLESGDEGSPPVLNAPVSYWLDLKEYNPVAEAAQLGKPMLILQGERDFQISMKDFNLWKSGLASKKDVVTKSYPNLNHLFVPGEGKSSVAEYSKPGHVAPEVIEEIAAFVKK